MAVSRKGWRRIVVAGVDYYWHASGREQPGDDGPGGIDTVVVTEAAFERGPRAQRLLFSLCYDHQRSPVEGGELLRQRAAIAPGVVARAIELAPEFTGAIGAPDIELGAEQVAQLQALARRG